MRNFFLFSIVLYITLNIVDVYSNLQFNNKKPTASVPPCRACKIFIESFKKGIERTAKGKFEGGDTAWEEEKLGKYATSEIRLTEIQEKLCSDAAEGKDECYGLYEHFEQEIEEWWFNRQNKAPDIFDYFCLKTFKHCCPEQHFGPDCTPCEGFPKNVCSGNGKCKGAGTRKGNGQCNCDVGYAGTKCDSCADSYYEAYKDDEKLLCSKCHPSCDGPCTKAGPLGCKSCGTGWVADKDIGCVDLNECASTKSPCGPAKFCINNEGSYRCLDCDRACGSCTGDGPDMCTACAKGYVMVGNMCIDQEQENRKQHIFLTRYLTYAGLCIATCIIFNKNTFLAALIGIAVAVYIAVSEYILNSPPIPRTDDIAKQILENN